MKTRQIKSDIATIGVIVTVTLVGFLMAIWITTVYLSVQELANYNQKYIRVWDTINRRAEFLQSFNSENQPTESVVLKTQNALTKDLENEADLAERIENRLQQIHVFKMLFLVSEYEEDILLNSQVDPTYRKNIENLLQLTPNTLRTGFSYWDLGMNVRLQSGAALDPLHARAEVVEIVRERSVKRLWVFLGSTLAITIFGVVFIWYKLMMPILDNLKKTKSDLQILFENMPAFLVSMDTSFRLLSSNSQYLNFLGINDSVELQGRHVRDLLGDENWNKIFPHAQKAARGESADFEISVVVKGREKIVHAMYEPQFQDGEVKGVTALIVDVTERRRSERALAQSEEQLRIMLGAVREAVIVLDSNSFVTKMNKTAEELTGLVLGKDALPLSQVLRLSESNAMTPVDDPMPLIVEHDAVEEKHGGLVLHSHTDDTYFISISMNQVEDTMGEDYGSVIVFRDITRELALNLSHTQDAKMRAIGQLAGGIAHDFNNMLGGIMGAAELLLEDDAKTHEPKEVELLEKILLTTKRASDLTSKLTSFARVTEHNFSSHDIDRVIEDALELIGNTSDRRIRIHKENTAENSKVFGNAASLQTAFLNIFINAVQAMPNGGTLSVRLSSVNITPDSECEDSELLEAGDYVKLCVEDTGVGIAPEDIDKIFEPFFTTKEIGTGTGLGLSAAYGTILDHQGTITVSSELGVGSEFCIYLPVTNVALEKPAVVAQYKAKAPANRNVLVVDDEPVVRDIAALILKKLGHNPVLAENGKIAVDIYKREDANFDLVLLDMNMPVMNGVETLRELITINPACKVVISSGFAEDQMFHDAVKNGAVDVLHKPYTIHALTNILERVLAN